MFQSLSQGSIIPILFKNEPRVADGKVLSVSTHMPIYNPNQPMAMLNGPVTGLPANGVMANFPDKGYFLATDKAAVIHEIESMMSVSKQALEQIPVHQKMVHDCEALLLSLQPEKQKEAQQAQEIESLKTQLKDMNGKFDQMVQMLSAKLGTVKMED